MIMIAINTGYLRSTTCIMNTKSFLMLTLMAASFHGSTAVRYDRRHEGLTAFPTDIPSDVTLVLLTNNSISEITKIPVLPFLTKLSLGNNLLSQFPDLGNVAATLTIIGLKYNQIQRIPMKLIIPLKKLTQILLDENPLVSLPNFGLLPPTPALWVSLYQMENFHCDWRMAAVKEAEAVGKVRYTIVPPLCSSPSSLESELWSAITIVDMISEGRDVGIFQQSTFMSYDVTSLAVYPTVTAILTDVLPTQCGALCLRSRGCTMFSTDSGNCVVTNLTSGPAADVTMYNDWYIRL